MQLPKIISHRARTAGQPENTLGALNAAANMGVPCIEFDVQLAACHTPVVFHDERLERMTNGRGFMADKTYTELLTLQIDTENTIPTMTEYCQVIMSRSLLANIEIKVKDKASAAIICETFQKTVPSSAQARFIFSSFTHETLFVVREYFPAIAIGLLYESLPDNWLEQASQIKATSIHVSAEKITLAQIQSIQSANYQCAIYTVNEMARAKMLLQAGASLFTDYPERFL